MEDAKKYIRDQRAAGFSDEQITDALRASGHTEEAIEHAFVAAKDPQGVTSHTLPGPAELLAKAWTYLVNLAAKH